MAEKIDKLTTQQVCNELQLNTNTRAYVEHKYKEKEYSLKEWKNLLKKDGLDIN